MPIQIASNFPGKKLNFNTKINVCTFAYMKMFLYLCITQEKEILS